MKLIKFVAFLVVALLAAQARADVAVSIGGAELVKQEGQGIEVKLPFDTEYTVNLNNDDSKRRALVHVRIDGRKVTGEGLVLRTGERVSLERFIDNGDLKRGKKFKFVENDEEVKQSRKANAEDGLIVVTVQYEKRSDPVLKYESPGLIQFGSTWSSLVYNPAVGAFDSTAIYGELAHGIPASLATSATLEPGVTIEGGASKQRFEKTEVGDLDDRIDTLTIKMSGYYKSAPLLMRGVR